MYDFALSALADAHRADLLREGCAHRRATKVAGASSLTARLASLLPGHSARVEPCTTC
ncbi:MAG TPA: hypothetical protein VNA14_12215 [Mycobacteriales bacterium]|nr:hypothetical protein [Mycobacteriales bacterium]